MNAREEAVRVTYPSPEPLPCKRSPEGVEAIRVKDGHNRALTWFVYRQSSHDEIGPWLSSKDVEGWEPITNTDKKFVTVLVEVDPQRLADDFGGDLTAYIQDTGEIQHEWEFAEAADRADEAEKDEAGR